MTAVDFVFWVAVAVTAAALFWALSRAVQWVWTYPRLTIAVSRGTWGEPHRLIEISVDHTHGRPIEIISAGFGTHRGDAQAFGDWEGQISHRLPETLPRKEGEPRRHLRVIAEAGNVLRQTRGDLRVVHVEVSERPRRRWCSIPPDGLAILKRPDAPA